MPDTMKALVGADDGSHFRLVQDAPIPAPPSGALLVRVHSVAFNPRDASKTVNFAGTVDQVGEGVTKFQVGDRVLAWSFGPSANDKSKDGSFAEFALAEQDSSCRVPEGIELADATSIGLGLATIGQLPPSTTVLVSGGATPTGIVATQLLKIAGYTPIVTCSPADNALCQENGAAACFDSSSADCGADIRVHTDNGLLYALDCIADDVSMKMAYEAIGSGSGLSYYFGVKKPASAIAIKYTRRDVKADWTLAGGVQVLDGGLDTVPAALEGVKTGRVVVPLTA